MWLGSFCITHATRIDGASQNSIACANGCANANACANANMYMVAILEGCSINSTYEGTWLVTCELYAIRGHCSFGKVTTTATVPGYKDLKMNVGYILKHSVILWNGTGVITLHVYNFVWEMKSSITSGLFYILA